MHDTIQTNLQSLSEDFHAVIWLLGIIIVLLVFYIIIRIYTAGKKKGHRRNRFFRP
jgi:beta-lactamase regulating signal transducer with metallopeptidase domain